MSTSSACKTCICCCDQLENKRSQFVHRLALPNNNNHKRGIIANILS